MAGTPRPLWRRIASGFSAAVLADLILGMGAFSVIALASLWYFSLGWLQLAREYAAVGRVFGTTGEVGLAWLGATAALPLLVVVLFLTERALRLPVRVYRGGPLPGAAGLRRWAAALGARGRAPKL